MSISLLIWSLVVIASIIEIIHWSISTIVRKNHSQHIREHALRRVPVVQIGKEWEGIYEPGDRLPDDSIREYEFNEID